MANTTKLDQLTEDPSIPQQQWVCVSFISPETLKNCNFRGIKIRGVYNTKEEASKRAEFLQKIDPHFNIYVGEVGKWLGWDPDPNTIDDQVYREQKLQEIMNNYNKNREKATELQEERKRNIQEETQRMEARKKATIEEEEEINRPEIKDSEHNTIDYMGTSEQPNTPVDSASANDNTLTAEKARLNEKEEILKKSENKVKSLDQKLNELQIHYKKLMEQKKH